jgi:hypothetical protein
MQLLKAGMEAAMAAEQLRQRCAPVQQATGAGTVIATTAVTAVKSAAETAGNAKAASAAVPATAKLLLKRKASPSPHLQTKYARIFVHPSGRISATGLADAIANKARRRLLASVEERE